METINYIGKYDSLELLWKAYPGGGIEGDYALIGDSYYGWDKYKSQWVETVLSEQTIIVAESSVETKDAVNFLGVFDSWADVWKSFPEGGHPGDYLTIDVTNYLWDASLLNWTTLSKDANVIEGETPAGSSPVELNYLGNFASMADVWYFFPEGGHLGDFVQVASVFYVWDTSSLNWKDSANTTYVNYDFSGKALEASQTRTTINYLGSFAELNDVWIVYPEGGHEGDYIHLSEEIQVWNKYRSNWGDYETPQTPAVKTDEIDGSLKITHDLIVGGTAYLSSIVTDLSKLGLHELSLYVNSALIGTYNPALGNSVFNIDGIATQEKLDDEVEKINLRIDETELSLRALISSISGSSHSHANLPVLNKITDEKLLNWDTAFSWGNHADAGYLKKVSTEQIIEALPDMYIGRSPIQYEEKAQDLTGISSLMLEGGEEILKYNSVYGAWELTGDLIVSGTLSIGAAASGGSGAEYTQWDWASIIKLSEDPGLGNLASAWALKQEYDDRKKDINTLTNSISGINSMIPATASQSNKLADIDFVNSSIANNAATFRGTFETISALPTSNVKPNDYAFVISENSEGNPEYQRYKYNGSSWVFEYTLNNSSFTAEQWAAITSGISAKKIENYDAHLTNKSNPHQVTASQVGLDQVENIKLSTWTGSTKITTLGTITTGVWNGTKIANAYLTNPKITIGSTIVNLGDTATAFDGLTSLKFAGANGALTYNSTDKYYNLADSLVVNGILAVGESGTGTSSGYTQLEWSDIQRLSKTEAGNLASAYAVKEVYNELNAAINTLASSATKVSFAPNLTGGKVIGTLTIDGTGTILYAPQNYAWGDITGKPTTIAGYGITDVKIANGIITIGSNTITPLTSHQKVSLASGTNNGTLKLTVGNTTTDNIAVKGLGSAAYTNSDAYAAASHTHSQYLTAHQTIYTLTIQKNGTQVDTYTPNSANKTINISDVASATTLSNHTGDKVSHITAAERTAWNTVAGLFGVDENGDIYVKNDKGFYTGGFLSAGSPGSGSSGGGYTQYEWDTIKEMTSKPAENGILASAWSVKQAYDELNKKATALSFKQTIASGVEIGTITIDNTSTKIYSPSLAALMGASAIGGESAYPYWNGSAWATKVLGSNAFTSISKVSQLTNDSGYITGITKAMVETVLTGNITSHTHSYIPLADKGLSNGKVPYYVDFPSYDTLVSLGYNKASTETEDEYYFKGLCKWAIDNFAGQGYIILIGNANPNVVGYCCIQLYSNGGKDANTGLPRYCSGTYIGQDQRTYNFGCAAYKWTWGGSFNGNASSSSKWATPRTITLTGSVTGSVSIDGSQNVSLATTTNHTHTFDSLTSKPTTISGYGITDALKIDGSNGTAEGLYALINKLATATATPTDTDYYICQFAGGGTTNTTYYRRPMSAMWNWIQAKTDTLYPSKTGTGATGTWGISISGNAASASTLYTTKIAATSSSIVYYKISGILNTSITTTIFRITTRNSESYLLYVNKDDYKIVTPRITRERNMYSKIISFAWSGQDLYIKVNGYSNGSYITQINGTAISYNVTTTDESTYNSATSITIDESAFLTSNVASATKWSTARTITLTGSVTGSVSIDGSADVSLVTTTNHTHSYLPLSGGMMSNTNVVTNLNADLLDGYHESDFSRHITGTTRTTGTKYFKLGNLPKSSDSTWDAFLIQGEIGGWGSLQKTVLNVCVGRRNGVAFFGYTQGLWNRNLGIDIGVNDAGEIVLIVTGQYCAWTLDLHTIQGTISYTGTTFTPTDTNFVLLSASNNVSKSLADGTVEKATKLANSRTIWGQSFDGTGNVSGALGMDGIEILDKKSNALYIGYGSAVNSGLPTYLWGKGINFINSGGKTKMLVTDEGNVGIGTTSPAARIEVNDNANNLIWQEVLRNSNNSNNVGWGVGLKLKLSSDEAPYEVMKWAGIAYIATSEYANYGALAFYSGSANYTTVERMRIADNGNVGIGTTSPSYKLHIVGTAYATENIIAAGDVTTGSDIRYKDKIQDLRLSVHDIALAPAFTYKWNNREDDALVHIGSSAQYWLNTDAKDAVYYDKQNDFYHLNYASLALCNTIILARGMETQEEKIARLEERINELEDKLRQYDSCR